jgi:hypothetical protein
MQLLVSLFIQIITKPSIFGYTRISPHISVYFRILPNIPLTFLGSNEPPPHQTTGIVVVSKKREICVLHLIQLNTSSTVCKWITAYHFLRVYIHCNPMWSRNSKTCDQRSPKLETNNGLYKQVVFKCRLIYAILPIKGNGRLSKRDIYVHDYFYLYMVFNTNLTVYYYSKCMFFCEPKHLILPITVWFIASLFKIICIIYSEHSLPALWSHLITVLCH